MGNRDRGTITEYVRGICFTHLIENNFDVDSAAKKIAGSSNELVNERVVGKINSYLENLNTALEKLQPDDEIPRSFYQGLPKKYHDALDDVIQYLRSISSDE